MDRCQGLHGQAGGAEGTPDGSGEGPAGARNEERGHPEQAGIDRGPRHTGSGWSADYSRELPHPWRSGRGRDRGLWPRNSGARARPLRGRDWRSLSRWAPGGTDPPVQRTPALDAPTGDSGRVDAWWWCSRRRGRSGDVMELHDYLLIGSYLMGSASWLFLYRELKSMRNQLTKELSDLKLEMTREVALRVGQDHEARIGRLERAMINAAAFRAES